MTKQSKDGSIVVTGEGGGLEGENVFGPQCTDWREKAFELARTSMRRRKIIRKLVGKNVAAREQIQQTKATVDAQLSFLEKMLGKAPKKPE